MNRPLVATYRVQLRPGFGFGDVVDVLPYLARLGVSHVYLSPVFEAAEGSTHGYDIVDHNRLRSDLGGEKGFEAMVAAAHDHGLGIVLDIVPHHMAATAGNDWWWSVLELGQASPYAGHFDIDWDPPARRLRGTVLLPVLGDHYGRVLDAGDLRLDRGKADALVVRYFDHVAPLSPETADELWAIAGRRGVDIEEVLAEVNADRDRLDGLLDRQHHRFARWQAAAHELDYRRFFDVDSLVALRTERRVVFDDCHRLTLQLVQDHAVDGLRVDHVDGLRDPAEYLARLRSQAPEAWIVVEKVLRPDEELPQWSVDGNTGYDFLADVDALLTEASGAAEIAVAYGRFCGGGVQYEDVRRDARREALTDLLDADLERLVQAVVQVCEHRRRWRDFTRSELRTALIELIVAVDGYRAYARLGEPVAPADRALVVEAVSAAARNAPDLDADVLDLFRLLFTGSLPGDAEREAVARFQQLTGPVAAKSEEDTAFYRWTPLLSANEVGARPDRPSSEPAAFHARCTARARDWPMSMLTTATHDTKRGEDVRARLALLSEIPSQWASRVARWEAHNTQYRDIETDAPDRRDEWFIYPTLVGAHPIPLDRAWTVIEKSLREAKRRTSWTNVDAGYESAVKKFLEAILHDDQFLVDLGDFVGGLVEPGRINSLTQVALRLLAPGVPDTYQGTELWDDSLVDPDNRRPVDFSLRARTLESVDGRSAASAWQHDQDSGAAKLALVRDCLRVRARWPSAFGPGSTYSPVRVAGSDAAHVVAFMRGDSVLVAVPRLVLTSTADDARLTLPPGRWHNVTTGAVFDGGPVEFNELRGTFPLVVVTNSGEKRAP